MEIHPSLEELLGSVTGYLNNGGFGFGFGLWIHWCVGLLHLDSDTLAVVAFHNLNLLRRLVGATSGPPSAGVIVGVVGHRVACDFHPRRTQMMVHNKEVECLG
jgi:hypothetical protein